MKRLQIVLAATAVVALVGGTVQLLVQGSGESEVRGPLVLSLVVGALVVTAVAAGRRDPSSPLPTAAATTTSHADQIAQAATCSAGWSTTSSGLSCRRPVSVDAQFSGLRAPALSTRTTEMAAGTIHATASNWRQRRCPGASGHAPSTGTAASGPASHTAAATVANHVGSR